MSEQSGDKKNDELLAKLDQLFKRHRQGEDSQAIPTLAAPVAATQDDIPVLTEAVSGPALSRGSPELPQPEAAIENRLSAALGREMNRLQVEMPQYSRQLALLSGTLGAAIKLLVRRYLGEQSAENSRADDPEQRS